MKMIKKHKKRHHPKRHHKKRRYRRMRFKEIIIWLGIFIVGSLIVTFLVSPGSFDRFKDNIVDITKKTITEQTITKTTNLNEPEDIQITKCLAKFNECKKISEMKTGVSIKINEYKKFTEYNKALEFYTTWTSPYTKSLMVNEMMKNYLLPKDNFPIVLIATSAKINSAYGTVQDSYVAVCDSSYNLIKTTKTLLNC